MNLMILLLAAALGALWILRRTRPSRMTGAVALAGGVALLAALPLSGFAGLGDSPLEEATSAADTAALPTTEAAPTPAITAPSPVERIAQPTVGAGLTAAAPAATTRQTEDFKTQPPLHGTNPHGQGTVATVDANPDPNRPYPGDTTGEQSGEEVVVGRARGEEEGAGSGRYRGHITIAALFGHEILGVDTQEGETRTGPLEPVQTQLLDAVCNGSGNQICLEVLTADSTTTDNGSQNRFAVTRAQVGGAEGINAGAAESEGNISSDGRCQTSEGSSRAATVSAGGQAVAELATSRSQTRACRNEDPQTTSEGRVLALGGTGEPIPAPGCGEGTPDVVTGIPTIAPIVCNALDVSGSQAQDPYVVRNALTVFALATDQSAVLSSTVAASEALAKAPPEAPRKPACSDGVDNDGDGKIDFPADPGCTSADDDSEADDARVGGAGDRGSKATSRPECSDEVDNDGDGKVDFPADPGCSSRSDDSERDAGAPGASATRGTAECSDGVDNDGDGVIDFPADRGCTSPADDSEAGAGPTTALAAGRLPFSGAEVLWTAIAGLLALGGGLALNRRQRASEG